MSQMGGAGGAGASGGMPPWMMGQGGANAGMPPLGQPPQAGTPGVMGRGAPPPTSGVMPQLGQPPAGGQPGLPGMGQMPPNAMGDPRGNPSAINPGFNPAMLQALMAHFQSQQMTPPGGFAGLMGRTPPPGQMPPTPGGIMGLPAFTGARPQLTPWVVGGQRPSPISPGGGGFTNPNPLLGS